MVEKLQIDQPRVSSHLAILLDFDLVSFKSEGRQRVYFIEQKEKISHLLDSLYSFDKIESLNSPKRSKQAERLVFDNSPLRQARTCYDHLAGVTGVSLLENLLSKEFLAIQSGGTHPTYTLTKKGREKFTSLGITSHPKTPSKRKYAYGCLDWTERKSHLGGFLGSEVLKFLLKHKYVSKQTSSRALTIDNPINLFD